MPKTKQLVTTMQEDIAVVTFQEARILDERNVQEIARELNDLIDKQYRTKMILNLGNVQYLSSAVIGKIAALHKRLQEENGELKICCVKKEIMEIFKVTGLDKRIDFHADLPQALAVFKYWRPKKKDAPKKTGFWGLFKK